MSRLSDADVRRRNESAWLLPTGDERTNHQLRRDMRRFDERDEVDIVVVGCGAGGGTFIQRMARTGASIVALDAGPFWDPTADWVSDELGSHHLYWTEPRVISGTDPVPLGSNNSGRGVGGSMIHYAGYTPRFHPSDFETHTRDGVGADWPISYGDLRSYYEDIEQELPVSGQPWPWGDPHRYPYSPQPLGGNGDIFLRGAHALGIDARIGPVAIANGRFGNRPHCIYRGFCLQGCKVNAKASPLITHIPDALAHGAEIRPNAMVTRVTTDDQGRATGVVYLKEGVEHHQAARLVVVAGYSIETPRLLLLSASSRFPDGLCNDYGQVGRLRDGPGRTPGRRPIRRRSAHVQGATPRGQLRALLRDRPHPALPARVLDPERLAAADHLRRTRLGPGPLGGGAARIHARLQPLGCARSALRVPAPVGELGDPGRRERPQRSPGGQLLLLTSATTTAPSWRPPSSLRKTSCARPGPARRSLSLGTPTSSAAVAWPPTNATASSTATSRASPSRTSTSSTAVSCPPRERPTRRSPSWPWPPAAPTG